MAQSDSTHTEDTKSAKIHIEDGVIITTLKDHAVVDLDEAKVHSEVFSRLTGNRAMPLLVVFGSMKKQTKEARDFFSKDPDHVQTYSAAALLVKNPLAKVFANFYMGLNKPPKPTRMFTDRDRAMEWLAQFK